MDELVQITKALQCMDLNNPQTLTVQSSNKDIIELIGALNKILTSFQQQKADMQILHKSFNEMQSNLLESQKITKMGSFEYDLKNDKFIASAQLYRLLGAKAKNELSWEDFLNYLNPAQRMEFLNKVNYAIAHGSKFVHRFSLLFPHKKQIEVESKIKVRKKCNGVLKLIGTMMDITKQVETEKMIEFLAFHDPLTGLGNRRLLDSKLNEAVAAAKRYDNIVGVFFIDIDRFKYINDTLGHQVGDRLIQEISKVLKNIIRESDTIIRLGGDEFVVLLHQLEDVEAVKSVAKKLLKQMKKAFTIDTHELFVTMSIGISLYPNHSSNPQELIAYADTAMYKAKEMGRNNFQIYELAMTKDFSD